MKVNKEELRKVLQDNKEVDYQKFNQKLIPGNYKILGIRSKILKDIAKKEKNNFALLNDYYFDYHEEIVLYAFIIAYSKMPDQERLKYVKTFLKYNNNWATNDSGAFSFVFIKKAKDFYLPFLLEQLASKKTYNMRFAITCFMKYYLEAPYFFSIKDKLCQLQSEEYYVNMALAWYFQSAYLVFPNEIKKLFQKKSLNRFVNNKAIQKICESRRTTTLEKDLLRQFKF